MSGETPISNASTLASYEAYADDYARATAGSAGENEALRRFVEALPAGACVLEIGSGPGWDADWLEGQGVSVRRTDATLAFVEMQRARGAEAELVNVVTDDILTGDRGGLYAGALAMYVFQHVERAGLGEVLGKVSAALSAGGVFLFSIREGERTLEERGDNGRTYYTAEWRKADVDALLRGVGLGEMWSRLSEDEEGRWLTFMAKKTA